MIAHPIRLPVIKRPEKNHHLRRNIRPRILLPLAVWTSPITPVRTSAKKSSVPKTLARTDAPKPTAEPAARKYQPGGYLKGGRAPMDPWGNPYFYESPGEHNEHSVDIWSHGADGEPGGDGVDADFGNWHEAEAS